MYELNSMVKVINKDNHKNYGRIGEVTGYAEKLPGGGFYHVVEFDSDNLIYVFLDYEIEPTGKIGNRKIRKETYLHIEDLIFRIRDTVDTDVYKPTSFTLNDIFVLRFPEEYVLEHTIPYMRNVVLPMTEFKNAKYLIVDYMRVKHMGYLGMGPEVMELLEAFWKNGGREYVFAIQDPNLEDIIKTLIVDKFPKLFKSFEDAAKSLGWQ